MPAPVPGRARRPRDERETRNNKPRELTASRKEIYTEYEHSQYM